MEQVQQWAEKIIENVEKVIFGKRDVIEKLLVALLCRGHALLEDVPGVGKTILARGLSVSLGGDYMRIQCTPDLLPADVLGVSVYNPKTGEFTFRQGPIVTNLLLVDEINRATPRTQSALLEAMSEYKITIEGETILLPDPFFMIATENPVEFEGTFPLPEAQKDRFFLTMRMGYPPEEAEEDIMMAQQRLSHPVTDLKPVSDLKTLLELQQLILKVKMDESISNYILDIVEQTRRDTRLQLGGSPRASMALYKGAKALAAIRGKTVVTVADIKELAGPILLKRISLKSENLIQGLEEERIVSDIVEKVEEPSVEVVG
jgi:MoxR-like ATPase